MLVVSYSRVCLLVLLCITEASGATFNDTKTLLTALLEDYNVNVRPVKNQSMPVVVAVQPFIKSIQEFDEVKEMFSFVGAVSFSWSDENLVWDPSEYGGVKHITVAHGEIWMPEMVLSSPSDDVESLGKKWNRIRIFYTGRCIWLPVILIKSTCSVNVRNYPFDCQSCVTSFNIITYSEEELMLKTAKPTIDMTIFQENTLWEIKNTSVVINNNQIDCTFYLQRKPSFVVINILLPILFLSLLNVLVFLLVPESGERASYCITVLLSIAVFMTIVSDLLPRSSQPVPMISFKLMVDMVISSLIVLTTILNLRIYSRDNSESVPEWLQNIYLFYSGTRFQSAKIQPADNVLTTLIPSADEENGFKSKKEKKMTPISVKTIGVIEAEMSEPKSPSPQMVALAEEILRRNRITWKKISYMFDWIAFVFFFLLSILSFAVFLVLTTA